MPPVEYSWEDRERAAELFIVEGRTFGQVAETTGVSESQLKRWSAQDQEADGQGWPEKRRELRRALADIPRKSVLLRLKLLDTALSGEPQAAYAFARVEAALNRSKGKDQAGAPAPLAEAPVTIKTPQEAVAALEGVVEKRINQIITQPGMLNYENLKDLKLTLQLVDELKAKYAPAADNGAGPAAGLSEAAAEEIRQQLLGMT